MSARASQRKARIAVVDDSEIVREWVKDTLMDQGYDVTTHHSAFGLHRLVRDFQPALILLDINMPALNGNLACKVLKSSDLGQTVLVILFSSAPVTELKKLVSECGADGFIVKTQDADQLRRDVQRFLRR